MTLRDLDVHNLPQRMHSLWKCFVVNTLQLSEETSCPCMSLSDKCQFEVHLQHVYMEPENHEWNLIF